MPQRRSLSHSSIEHSDKEDMSEKSHHIDATHSKPFEEQSRPSKLETAATQDIAISPTGILYGDGEEVELAGRGRPQSQSSQSLEKSRTLSGTPEHPAARPHDNRSRAASSARSVYPAAVQVPKNARRGLFAQLSILAEVDNAWHYSRKTKWMITAVIALAGAAAPMGSSIILPGLNDIAADFHTTNTVVNLSVAMYMLSMSIFPLWWSSFSETLGRRTIYLTSFFLYLIFNILSAVSTNIAMFIVMRILSGGAAGSVQSVGAGTIADMWESKERGRAMGIFYLGPLLGPATAPIIGGVLAQELGWRSCQWFLAIFGGVILILILFVLPETLHYRRPLVAEATQEAAAEIGIDEPKSEDKAASTSAPLSRISTRQSVQLRTKKYMLAARRAFVDPLRIVLYLQFPAVLVTVLYASVTFGSLYMLNISIQATFDLPPYSYSTIIIGLLYLPQSTGYFLASIFGGRWVDHIMAREARAAGRYDANGKLIFRPEDRMKENAWVASIVMPAAMLAYGWLARYGVNLAAPLVMNFFFGAGAMLIFALVTTMLTEFMARKASNGVAVNNFLRNIFSCVGVIVAQALIDAIGDGWLFTGLSIITFATGMFTLWVFKTYGDHWRVTMDRRMDEVMGE